MHRIRPALTLLLLLSGSSLFAQSTLSVDAVTPLHGATNVPLPTTISVTFSAPIDTAGFIPFDGDTWPVQFIFAPDTSETSSSIPAISTDRRTFSFPVQLMPNRRYTFVVEGARGAAGEHLDRPVVSTFTTGAALPQGSISGTVGSSVGGPGGTLLTAVSSDLFSGQLTACFGVAADNGDYTIDFVPAGDYFVFGTLDLNGDGDGNPQDGDPTGAYDGNSDQIADIFTVADGQARGGIDFPLAIAEPISEEVQLPKLTAAAQATAADAVLVAIVAGQLDLNGKAIAWLYFFYSASLDQQIGFTATSVGCLPGEPPDFEPAGQQGGDTGFPALTTPLPDPRKNAAEAFSLARANGGDDFLAENPQAEITVLGMTVNLDSLFQFGDGSQRLAPKAGAAQPPASAAWLQQFAAHPGRPARLAQIEGETPAWVFLFRAPIDFGSPDPFASFFAVAVHMQTGAVIPLTPSPSLVAPNVQAAEDTAASLVPDAVLVGIIAPSFGFALPNLKPNGKALFWLHVFYSPSLDSLFAVEMSNGRVFNVGSNALALPSTQPLPDTFLNSDQAVAAAEAAGGAALRQANSLLVLEAVLGFGLYPDDPARLVWAIIYGSILQPPDQVTTFYVDATTGTILTDVEETAGEVPQNFSLLPAYPNPLRAGQVLRIPFELAGQAEVEINLYNILGQRVKRLSLGRHGAGTHAISVAALRQTLAAGVYFIRMHVRLPRGGERIFARRLMLR